MDFDVVNNNTVVPKGNFTVNAVILGSAFVREASVHGQRTMVKFPVTCSLKLGDYKLYTNPSKGNINDGKNPRFWSSNNTSKASTSVKVEACSWENIISGIKSLQLALRLIRPI